MSKNINRVFCHRKSGASYVVRSIMANYYCNDFDKNHWHFSDSMVKAIADSDIALYVVRDGRDVLYDCYEYWKQQPGTKKHFEGKTFRQYIMGYIEAYSDKDLFEKTAETKNPLDPRMFSDPVQYWVDHVQGFINSNLEKMYFVNYDMMLIDGAAMLMHIGDYFKLEPRNKLIEPLEDLTLYKPLFKDVGVWRLVFGQKDLEYFWGRAEDTMIKLKFSYN
ncbi:MAG TPA: hypothetical protein VI911_07705 [Patescibacteria group bacterium]|nr:hypothetical protein [Patescibacteria group bacterium]